VAGRAALGGAANAALTQPRGGPAGPQRLADPRQCSDDGRGVLVGITAEGSGVLRQAAGVHAQTIREFLLDPLTPVELDLLDRALRRITEN